MHLGLKSGSLVQVKKYILLTCIERLSALNSYSEVFMGALWLSGRVLDSRLSDRPAMTIAVDLGCKATKQKTSKTEWPRVRALLRHYVASLSKTQ